MPQSGQSDARKRYEELKAHPVALDLTRGKPCAEQLDLSNDLLTILERTDYRSADGTDCRNYGGLDGLPEARALFGELLDVKADQVIIGEARACPSCTRASRTLFARRAGWPNLWAPKGRAFCPCRGTTGIFPSASTSASR
jgi:hypothetical protein